MTTFSLFFPYSFHLPTFAHFPASSIAPTHRDQLPLDLPPFLPPALQPQPGLHLLMHRHHRQIRSLLRVIQYILEFNRLVSTQHSFQPHKRRRQARGTANLAQNVRFGLHAHRSRHAIQASDRVKASAKFPLFALLVRGKGMAWWVRMR